MDLFLKKYNSEKLFVPYFNVMTIDNIIAHYTSENIIKAFYVKGIYLCYLTNKLLNNFLYVAYFVKILLET